MDKSEIASSLRLAISMLHKGLRKELTDSTGYSMTELETIGHLFKTEKMLPTELARETRITTQSMSQILSKLESQGVIVKTPAQTDKRKVYISITEFGTELIKRTQYERDLWLIEGFEQSLDKKELELLEKALPILYKLTKTN
jgi:DNA-binding MarR family transcriptional regulator